MKRHDDFLLSREIRADGQTSRWKFRAKRGPKFLQAETRQWQIYRTVRRCDGQTTPTLIGNLNRIPEANLTLSLTSLILISTPNNIVLLRSWNCFDNSLRFQFASKFCFVFNSLRNFSSFLKLLRKFASFGEKLLRCEFRFVWCRHWYKPHESWESTTKFCNS